MTGRRAALGLALCLLVVLPVAACSGPETQTVDGLVVSVVGDSPVAIQSFELHTADGRTLTFTFDGPIPFGGNAFPGQHLREHEALALPVRVTYRVDGSGPTERLVVVRLEDVILSPSPSAS